MSKEVTYIQEGRMSKSEVVSATASRNINTFEVLDYDIYNSNYALIYKDITIVHNQSQNYTRSTEPYSGNYYRQYLYSNLLSEAELPARYTVFHNDSDVFTAVGTRTVTYKLHYKIGTAIFSVDLATCIVKNDNSVYTMTGERIYGVSIQVSEEVITYAFEKHTANLSFFGAGIGYPYDSPRNLEDWNVNQLNVPIWIRSKQVVGLISIDDGVESDIGYLKQQEYDILPEEQYAVGIVSEITKLEV